MKDKEEKRVVKVRLAKFIAIVAAIAIVAFMSLFINAYKSGKINRFSGAEMFGKNDKKMDEIAKELFVQGDELIRKYEDYAIPSKDEEFKVVDKIKYEKTESKYSDVEEKYKEVFAEDALKNAIAIHFKDVEGTLYSKVRIGGITWSLDELSVEKKSEENGVYTYIAKYKMIYSDDPANKAHDFIESEFKIKEIDGAYTIIETNFLNMDKNNKENTPVEDIKQEEQNTTQQQAENGEYEITYKEEVYKSYNQNGGISFENKRNLPVVKNTSNQSAADEIIKSLTSISNEKWNEITNTSDEFKDAPSGSGGVNYLLSTYLVNDKYIVFKAERTGSFGGAGWTAEEYYNFDAKTGKRLTLKNISSNYNDLEKNIVNKTVDYINKNVTVIVDDVEKEVRELITSEDGVWGITKEGLEIKLPKNSIGTSADGIITVNINKTDVNKYLLENYEI